MSHDFGSFYISYWQSLCTAALGQEMKWKKGFVEKHVYISLSMALKSAVFVSD